MPDRAVQGRQAGAEIIFPRRDQGRQTTCDAGPEHRVQRLIQPVRRQRGVVEVNPRVPVDLKVQKTRASHVGFSLRPAACSRPVSYTSRRMFGESGADGDAVTPLSPDRRRVR